MSQRHDPDKLVALEEERDFLLKSLDDLEVEYQAGDLDEHDYLELRDDYTVRSAAAIRSIDDQRVEAPARSKGRRLGWVVGLVAFGVAAGFLMAQFAGERGTNDSLTGNLDESIRDKNLRCQELGASAQLEESLTCFDEILLEDPQNVEALSYRGWFLVLTVGSAQEAGADAAASELLTIAQGNLAQAVEVDPTYAPARAFRAVVFERLGDIEATCAELQILDELDPPILIEQLVSSVAERAAC